jgi:endonuclease III
MEIMAKHTLEELVQKYASEIATAAADETAVPEQISDFTAYVLVTMLEKIIDTYATHESTDKVDSEELAKLIGIGIVSMNISDN